MKQFFQIENIEQQVKKDIWGLQRQFKRAAKRRTVPTFAAPLETYWMMFHPNYKISSGDYLGLGGVRTKVSSHEFFTCVRHLLYAIYWRQWAPLRWAHAEAAQLPKTSKKTHPCAQVRLIFLFCPFGKAFFAQLMHQQFEFGGDFPLEYSDYVHGFVPKRRRESAVLCAKIVPMKMNQIYFSCMNDLHDKANAFLSISKSEAAVAARKLVPDIAAAVADHHIQLSSFSLHCPDCSIAILGGCGILPGASLVVAVWVQTFQPVIDQYAELDRQSNKHAHVMDVQSPDGHILDVSLNVYADDTHKAHAVPAEKVQKLVGACRRSSRNLDRSLLQVEVVQNLDKREIVPHLVCHNKSAWLQYFFHSKAIGGKVVRDARYLGSRLCVANNNVTEREKRVTAMNRGFAEMGAFWHESTNWRHVRSVFIAKVYSASFAGLAAFCWSRSDSNVVEKRLCFLLRRAAHKFVCEETDTKFVSLNNSEMLQRFHLAPHFENLRVCRLRMYQAWALCPHAYRQPIACLFGTWCSEDITDFSLVSFLLIRPLDACNGFVRQFVHDLSQLQFVQGGDAFLSELKERYAALFTAGEEFSDLVHNFVSLDVSELRVRHYYSVIPPHSRSKLIAGLTPLRQFKQFRFTQAQYDDAIRSSVVFSQVASSEELDSLSSFDFVCNCLHVSGEPCRQRFSSSQGLFSHMRSVHAMRNIVSTAVVSNTCIFCHTAFRTVGEAKAHAVRSYVKGKCKAGRTRIPHEPQPRPKICPLCHIATPAQSDFDRHILLHFTHPPQVISSRHGLARLSEGLSDSRARERKEKSYRAKRSAGFGFSGSGSKGVSSTSKREGRSEGWKRWKARKAEKDGWLFWLPSGAQRARRKFGSNCRLAWQSHSSISRRFEGYQGIDAVHVGVCRPDERIVGGESFGGSSVQQNDCRGQEGGGGGRSAFRSSEAWAGLCTQVSGSLRQNSGASGSGNGQGSACALSGTSRSQEGVRRLHGPPRSLGDCWSVQNGECSWDHEKVCDQEQSQHETGASPEFLPGSQGIRSSLRQTSQERTPASSAGRSRSALMSSLGNPLALTSINLDEMDAAFWLQSRANNRNELIRSISERRQNGQMTQSEFEQIMFDIEFDAVYEA